jgi:peptidoglycan-associated lipoprotein
MHSAKLMKMITILMVCFSFTSCCRNADDVWDDTKTASRHIRRGFYSLGGYHTRSRQVQSPDEFMCWEEDPYYIEQGSEFEYFADDPNMKEASMAEYVSRQPTETPGDPGSRIPGIESFKDPQTIPGMASVFKNICFDYNSNLVKGQGNSETIRKIADYIRAHPNTYVFIEGHCDQRGAEAYNLALGSRRSNAVRNVLIDEGVDADHLFTVSYGKERPLDYENNEDAWCKNRRAEFKIYVR